MTDKPGPLDGLEPTAPPSDATLTSSAGDAGGRVVIRSGAPADYVELVEVDRKHYIVTGELGRGGMGRVLTARDRRLGRTVAIKELLATSASSRRRFEREARITARLQHPAIVNLLEAGVWPSGEPFYVMKLVSGEPFDHAIRAATTLRDRLALLPNVIAVADALAYAHAHRVIHRDLKPANIIVGTFGETVVIDWGLAKDLTVADDDASEAGAAHDGGETIAGSVMGTPAYMSAEQAAGERVDERTDVYALGAILYQLLAGTTPYTGTSTDELLDAIASGPPPPIRARAEDTPPDLAAIVDRAVAHSAGDRYPSARELVADLKRFQTGQLVGAHRYSTGELVRRWLRRHRTAVAVAAVAFVALATLGTFSVARIVAEQRRTEVQRAAAVQSRDQAEDLVRFMLGDLKDRLEPLGKLPLLDVVARKVLAYFDAHPTPHEPDALDARARALIGLGEVLAAQNALVDARRLFAAAIEIRAALVALAPANPTYANGLGVAHARLGELLRRQGDLDGARRAHEAERVIFDRLATAAPSADHPSNSCFTSSGCIGRPFSRVSSAASTAASIASSRSRWTSSASR